MSDSCRDAFETWRESKGYGHGAVWEAWQEAWGQAKPKIVAAGAISECACGATGPHAANYQCCTLTKTHAKPCIIHMPDLFE